MLADGSGKGLRNLTSAEAWPAAFGTFLSWGGLVGSPRTTGIKAVWPCGGSAAAKTPSHLGSARSTHARTHETCKDGFHPIYRRGATQQISRACSQLLIGWAATYVQKQLGMHARTHYAAQFSSGCGVSSDRARLADAVRSVEFSWICASANRERRFRFREAAAEPRKGGSCMAVHVPDVQRVQYSPRLSRCTN